MCHMIWINPCPGTGINLLFMNCELYFLLHYKSIKSVVTTVDTGLFAEEDPGRQGMSVSGNATASKGLEVAVGNLQEYCNGMVCLYWFCYS